MPQGELKAHCEIRRVRGFGNVNEATLAYPGWRVTVASGIGVFVSFGSLLVYTFGIFLKPLTEEFAWSRQAVSLAFGIAAMALAIASPPLGYLIDRLGPRRVILSCLTTFGCAFASLALLTPHLGHLYVVFAILGLVGNGAAHLAYSRVVSTWFDRRRGMALAVLMAGGALGAIFLPPTAQFFINNVGWRGAFLVLGALSLGIGLPVVARFVREKPGLRSAGRPEATHPSFQQGLRSRAFWVIVAVLFLSSISQNGAMTHLAALLTDRGVSASGSALAVSVMGATSLLGRIGTGWLLDHFFAPRVAFWVLAFAALGVFLLSGARSLFVGALGAGLIGVGMGGEADIIPYLLSKYFGLRSFSTLYGFTWTAYALAAALGPVLMGRAFDAAGSYETFLLQLSVITLASGGLMLLMPRYPAGVDEVAASATPGPTVASST
jgi:MFS family permease